MKRKLYNALIGGTSINNVMFLFNHTQDIYIYGASYMGSVTGKALQTNGIAIKGFIDQRADDIGKCAGLPVYTLEEFCHVADTQSIIFVAVKNVYYHAQIAQQLFALGYQKIIYKTSHAIRGTMSVNEQILDKAYESIYKSGDIPPFRIPVIEPICELEYKPPRILQEENGYLTFCVPLEQLYTGTTVQKWTNVPVLTMIPHIRLFQFFEGTISEYPNDYIELCAQGARNENIEITDSWKNYVLKNRFHTYEQMRWRYDYEPEFFIKQAPEAAWNPKGYFNLLTGKHRICFLAAMGKSTVAIKMKKQEWDSLFSQNCFQEICQILEENPNIILPLPHFYFQGNMQYHCMFVQKKLRKIYEQMYDEYAMRGNDRKITRIYDLTSEHGYFATIFTQMGFQVSMDRNFSSEIEKIYTKMGMKVSNGVCSKKNIWIIKP